MDRKNTSRTKMRKSSQFLFGRTNSTNILPPIKNSMGKTYNHFHILENKIQKKRKILLSSDLRRKYQLDSKNYQKSINFKNEQIGALEKKCEFLIDKNKFNNEIANELLANNRYNINYNNLNRLQNSVGKKVMILRTTKSNSKSKSKSKEKDKEKVKEYKTKKKTLDILKNEYFSRKKDIESTRNSINEIKEDLDKTRYKIEMKQDEVIGLKSRLKKSEKDQKMLQDAYNKKDIEKEFLHAEIIKGLEKQIKVNKEKLNDNDKKIKESEQDIEELKKKLHDLEKYEKK